MKSFHKRGGGSLRFHTLIQISYILLYTSSFTVKIWIRISQIQHGGGGTILWKFFIKFRFFLNDGFPKFLKMSLCDCLNMNSNSVPVIPIISSISYSTGIGSNQTRWFKPNIYFLLSVCTMCRCLLSISNFVFCVLSRRALIDVC